MDEFGRPIPRAARTAPKPQEIAPPPPVAKKKKPAPSSAKKAPPAKKPAPKTKRKAAPPPIKKRRPAVESSDEDPVSDPESASEEEDPFEDPEESEEEEVVPKKKRVVKRGRSTSSSSAVSAADEEEEEFADEFEKDPTTGWFLRKDDLARDRAMLEGMSQIDIEIEQTERHSIRRANEEAFRVRLQMKKEGRGRSKSAPTSTRRSAREIREREKQEQALNQIRKRKSNIVNMPDPEEEEEMEDPDYDEDPEQGGAAVEQRPSPYAVADAQERLWEASNKKPTLSLITRALFTPRMAFDSLGFNHMEAMGESAMVRVRGPHHIFLGVIEEFVETGPGRNQIPPYRCKLLQEANISPNRGLRVLLADGRTQTVEFGELMDGTGMREEEVDAWYSKCKKSAQDVPTEDALRAVHGRLTSNWATHDPDGEVFVVRKAIAQANRLEMGFKPPLNGIVSLKMDLESAVDHKVAANGGNESDDAVLKQLRGALKEILQLHQEYQQKKSLAKNTQHHINARHQAANLLRTREIEEDESDPTARRSVLPSSVWAKKAEGNSPKAQPSVDVSTPRSEFIQSQKNAQEQVLSLVDEDDEVATPKPGTEAGTPKSKSVTLAASMDISTSSTPSKAGPTAARNPYTNTPKMGLIAKLKQMHNKHSNGRGQGSGGDQKEILSLSEYNNRRDV